MEYSLLTELIAFLFVQHLKSKHASHYKDVELEREEEKRKKVDKQPSKAPNQQPTLQHSLQQCQPYARSSPRCKKLDTALVDMIALDVQPTSIVEDKGFLKFVNALDPRYEPPSRRTIMRSMLPARYESIRDELKDQLTSVRFCALTSDLWTSRQTLGYITVTCHFIDSSWGLRSVVLATTNLTKDHTAENVADELKRITDEWNITDKVVAVVTDNAANIVAAVRLNGWKHIPCFAHTLNLVVQDALTADPILSVIQKKCRDIVTYFHRSCKATERLTSIQVRLNLPDHKLVQDVSTRWNSTFLMFERIIEQNEAVVTTLCLLNRSEMCLGEDEVSKIKQAVTLLQPFEAATRELSADKYVSLSKVIPIAKSLQQLTVTASSASSLSLGQLLVTQMDRRFLNIESNPLLASACLLDPRFKKVAFADTCALDAANRRLVNEMTGTTMTTPEPEESGSGIGVNCQTVTSNPLWKQFDQRVRDSSSERTTGVEATVEKQQYLQHKNIERHEHPLCCWEQNHFHLPQLQELARKYLCIPGTSVPSERLFSKAGEVVAARRSNLKPCNVDKILFLNKNL